MEMSKSRKQWINSSPDLGRRRLFICDCTDLDRRRLITLGDGFFNIYVVLKFITGLRLLKCVPAFSKQKKMLPTSKTEATFFR